MLDRLIAIPGIAIPGIAIPEDSLIYRPALPLKDLAPAETRKRFLAVLDWVINEVKENA